MWLQCFSSSLPLIFVLWLFLLFVFFSFSLAEATSDIFFNWLLACSMSWAIWSWATCSNSWSISSLCIVLAWIKAISLLAQFFGSKLSLCRPFFLFNSLLFPHLLFLLWSLCAPMLFGSYSHPLEIPCTVHNQYFLLGFDHFLYEDTTFSSFCRLHSMLQRNWRCPFK